MDRHCFDADPIPDPDFWIGVRMESRLRIQIGIKTMPKHNTGNKCWLVRTRLTSTEKYFLFWESNPLELQGRHNVLLAMRYLGFEWERGNVG